MKKAFTLNELLISLAIIGVILIITVPIVFSHFSKKSQVAALQRTYTAFTNAVKLMMIDERVSSISKTSLYYASSTTSSVEDTAGAFLQNYFKVSKDCGTEPDKCFASSYVNLEKKSVALPPENDAYCVSISTGASICLTPPGFDGKVGKVWVDVNGPLKPNIGGRDLFLFYIYSDGFIGDRISTAGTFEECRANKYGSGCFNRVINADWTMDY